MRPQLATHTAHFVRRLPIHMSSANFHDPGENSITVLILGRRAIPAPSDHGVILVGLKLEYNSMECKKLPLSVLDFLTRV